MLATGKGAFYNDGNKPHTIVNVLAPSSNRTGAAGNFSAIFDTERVVPTGAANVPRSWGSLACAYFGQPNAA
ncbi:MULTISPECIES: hypothetical protein [unclassified Desulfovibrio]|uniref:hypothetical protein n=1 Tax=unclassified Desulfovibrio TaxID=2593640 RepID=UPI0013ED81F6|nr:MULTISPECIES: hypothetical protein [unclassified Desulfovibrio]